MFKRSKTQWCAANRLTIIQRGAGALDLFGDIGRFGCPDKGLGIVVVLVDVVAYRHNQFLDISEDAAAEPLLGEIAEEALDHVEPRAARRSEVHVKTRMAHQPLLYFRMLVRCVVVC